MFSQLKQFKELRDKAKQIKDLLGTETAEGSADWGKIKVQINGNQEVLKVEIDPELLQTTQKDKLENDIKDATNDALKKVQKLMAEKIQQSGLSLPNLQ